VYATIPGDAEVHANHLIALDVNGEVVSSVHIGSEPGSMAISDDHSALWVSLRGSFSIRRVDLTGDEPSPGVQHRLPLGESGELGTAGPMVVLPGKPDSVAVSIHLLDRSPTFDGVVLFDAGVARPKRTPGHTGAACLTGGPEGYLFGFDNGIDSFPFYSIRIGPEGLSQRGRGDMVSGFGEDIVYYNNRVFATSGAVVDVSVPGSPRREGVFAFQGSVIPQQDGTVVMLSSPFSDQGATLRLLDVDTFTQLESVPVGLQDIEVVLSFVQFEPGTYAVVAGGYSWKGDVYVMSKPSFKR
jgi:hypothetical protein